MPIDVYPWPPVPARRRSWLYHEPTAVSRSPLTGKEVVQSSQRARRIVTLEVSGLNADRSAGGYMDSLGRLLRGQTNAVRLASWSPNWHLDQQRAPGHEWLSIRLTATATTSRGFAAWRIAGLPPMYPLMRPGDRFSVGATVYQTLNDVAADASGVAVSRVLVPTSGTGAVTLDAQESAVFRADSIPTAPQSPGADFVFSWSFREIFADEVGGFTERDPWTA